MYDVNGVPDSALQGYGLQTGDRFHIHYCRSELFGHVVLATVRENRSQLAAEELLIGRDRASFFLLLVYFRRCNVRRIHMDEIIEGW